MPETRPTKARGKTKTNEEKKKPATPRGNKKKGPTTTTTTTTTVPTPSNYDETPTTSTEITMKEEKIPDPISTPLVQGNKRRVSGTESEDIDEPQSRVTNGKSDQESDGSTGVNDRSSNENKSSANAPEKKGGRTTIKPQQLEVRIFVLLIYLYIDCLDSMQSI